MKLICWETGFVNIFRSDYFQKDGLSEKFNIRNPLLEYFFIRKSFQKQFPATRKIFMANVC